MKTFKMMSAAFAMALSLGGVAHGKIFVDDPAHTSVTFEIDHLGGIVSGRFNRFDMEMSVKARDDGGKSLDLDSMKAIAKINAASIDTGNKKRDSHLRSKDFFYTAKNKYITFKSKGTGRSKGNKWIDLKGDLTLNGVTKKNVTMRVNNNGTFKGPKGKPRIGLVGEMTVNRKDYGLKWSKLVEGVPVIGDEVRIRVLFEGKFKTPKKVDSRDEEIF